MKFQGLSQIGERLVFILTLARHVYLKGTFHDVILAQQEHLSTIRPNMSGYSCNRSVPREPVRRSAEN